MNPSESEEALKKNRKAGNNGDNAAFKDFDWASTSLGPEENWSAELKTTISICENSIAAMMILWGDEKLFICNQSFISLTGLPLQKSLGKPVSETGLFNNKFSSLYDEVRKSGQALKFTNQSLPFELQLDGFPYYDFTLFPILKEDSSSPEGVVFSASISTENITDKRSKDRVKEEELIQRAELYREMFQNLPVGAVFIIDKDYRYVLAEGKTLYDAGMKPSDLEGKKIREALPVELSESYIKHFDIAFRGENFEYEHHSHGRHYISHGMPLRDKKGDIQAVLSFSYEITERKLAENALRESQERLKLVTRATRIGTYYRDIKAGNDTWSEEFLRIFGLGPGETVKVENNIPEQVHPDDRKLLLQKMKRAIYDQKKTEYSHEHRIVLPTGEVRWILNRGKTEFDKKGNPKWTYGIVMDITERKKTERQILQNEKILQEILYQMPSGVSILDASTAKLLFYNEEATKILGHPLEQFAGVKELENFGAFHPDNRSYRPEEYPITRALKGETIIQEEMMYRRGDGQIVTLSVNAAPIRDERGRIVRTISTFQDITEKKRSREIMQRAKDEAEKAAKVKEEFLSHMSHEIRTPLHGVIGITDLLLNQNPREDQMNNLKALKFSSRNLLQLINDILDYSKIEAGKAEIKDSDFHLSQLLNGLVYAHLPAARENKTSLKFYLDDRIPQVIRSDQLKLSQILNNLLSNAVKFTREGKVNINVDLLAQNKDNLKLKFTVNDTGIGISKDKLNAIFDKFVQIKNDPVLMYGGTGLGLSITRGLLQLMGSSIEIESEPGQGSIFRFILDVKPGNPELLEGPDIQIEKDELPKENLKILIAEDVEINRNIIEQLLFQWWQVKPDTVTNGQEAILLVREKAYDIILMDLRMPVLDGYEAAKQIRNIPGRKNIPIIALTADSLQNILKNPDSRHFNDYLIKPLEPSLLKSRITDNLENKANKPENPDQAKSFSKMEKFFEAHPERTRVVLQKAITSLNSFKQEFTKAMKKKNLQDIRNLKHDATVLLSMFELEDIKELFEESKEMLMKEAKTGEVENQLKKGESLFAETLEAFEGKLRELE